MLTLTRDYAAQARIASAINIPLGIWLVVSPWMLHYSAMGLPATLNSMIVGALIVVLAAVRFNSWRDTAPFSWINLVLGLWTIASPWVYGYAAKVVDSSLVYGYAVHVIGLSNSVIVGVLVSALAILSGGATIAEKKHPPTAPAH
jgi:SPW repeat